MLRHLFGDQNGIVLFNFFFQCLRNLENMAKIFLHALSILKKHMIAFLTWKVLLENGIDGQLLHVIKCPLQTLLLRMFKFLSPGACAKIFGAGCAEI